MSMFEAISILVLPVGRFKKLDRWISKFKGHEIGKGVIAFDSINIARAFVMVGERFGSELLLLALKDIASKISELGLLVLRSEQSKIFKDLLIRVFKYGGIPITYPTIRGFPTIVFPQHADLERFIRFESASVLRYSNVLINSKVFVLRRKDIATLRRCIMMLRKPPIGDAMKKSGITLEDLMSIWSTFLSQCSSASS